MLLLARVWGVFWHVKQVYFVKIASACLSEMAHIVGILCRNVHVRIHTRTAKNMTLHHPSVHSGTDTDRKHNKSRQFRTHLDQSRNCLFRILRVRWMRSVDSPSPSPLFILLKWFELAEHSKADPTIDVSHGANARILGRDPH